MSERVFFVTGAGGFVGRHLCERLRSAGQRVRGLVRRDDPSLTALGVTLFHGDLAHSADWQAGLAGVDVVVHCAANASFGNGPQHDAVNVEGTRTLLAAVQSMAPNLHRFVFVSTIGVVDRATRDACQTALTAESPLHPTSDYGRSKARAEQLVRDSALPFCIVRPALVVGGDMRFKSHFAVFARLAVQRAPLARFAWPGRFSVVHVEDLAAGLELCATHPDAVNRTYFCAGTAVSLATTFVRSRPGEFRLPLGWVAAIARTFPQLVPFKLKALLLPALVASDEPLRQLGWRPRHDGTDALTGVIAREQARFDPDCDPGGQTVVTGAASGLGRALVARVAPHRKRLLLVDRDRAGLEAVQARHPHCRIAVVDLSDEAAVTQLTRSPAWRAHPVRELFACAGFGLRGPVLAAEPAAHARLFQVNVLARLALAHAALPDMLRAQFGRVLFISSSSAFQPLPYMATYAASNAALLSASEAWAAELSGTGVHLLVACPGGMQTNFQASAGVKTLASERLMPPELVVEHIFQALKKRRTTVIISTRAHGMALVARLLPRAWSVALWKRLMARLR